MGWSKLSLRNKGLFTWPNPLIEIPEGGMVIAKNLVIDRESTAEPRRGYSELDYPLGTNFNNRADQLMTFGPEDLICHYGFSGLPSKLAFFSRIVEGTGTIAAGTNIISNLPVLTGLYVGQIVKSLPRETIFLGDQVLGSNTITNVLSTQGLYIGLAIGGQGIISGTTITGVSGTGPYTITLSSFALFTQTGNTLTATDTNVAGIPADTRITAIGTSSITLSANCTATSRSLTFNPADVDTGDNFITINNHGFVDGDSVQFSSTVTLPAPLNSSTIYSIVLSNSSTFKVSLTPGGSAVNITSQGTGIHTVTQREDFTAAGWIDYPGIFVRPPDNVKMRYAEANNSLYITTDEGIKVLDNVEGITFIGDVTTGSDIITNIDILDVTIGELVSGAGIPAGAYVIDLVSATSIQISAPVALPLIAPATTFTDQKIFVQPRLAGIPAGLDGDAIITTDATGFFTADRAIAYKIVWAYKNFSSKTYKGAPSSTINVFNNTAAAKNVQLTFTVPREITPGYTYQIYRSGFSANATSTPPQDYALIYEASPTYAEVVNQLVVFNDNVPESLRTGAALYTNESQEGSASDNFVPPFATDLASFKNSLFLSNTKTKHNLTLTINSASGQFSILGDTVAVGTDAFKSQTISTPNLSVTADIGALSDLLTNISVIEMAALAVGMTVTHASLPSGTVIVGFDSATSVRLSNLSTNVAAQLAQTIVVSVQGIRVGQTVLPPDFPIGTTVQTIFVPTTLTGNIVGPLNPSPMISQLSSISGLAIGQPISAASGIASGALIQNLYESTSLVFAPGDVNVATNTFTLVNHGLVAGNVIRFMGSSLPTPIVAGTDYYVLFVNANQFQISATFGGVVFALLATGSGTIELSSQVRMTDNATATLVGAAISFDSGYRATQGATANAIGTTLTFKNGTGGIEALDTIAIAGITYEAYTNEDISNLRFKVYSHGSPAQNIANTAQSLVRVINRQTSVVGTPQIYAYYMSAVGELPGEIIFISRTLNTNEFYATADSAASGAAYTPNLPIAPATTVFSTNDELKNGIWFSKTDQPEAFPLGNSFTAGSEKEIIIRSIALRDSLFALKNDGIFRVSGETPQSFQVIMFDNTIKLAAPESAASLSNTIFCLSTEGVASISDSNVQIMSRPIENLILDAFKADQVKVRTLSYGIAYTSDRKYILFTITNAEDTAPTQAFVYNAYTNTWTVWEMTRTCGAVSSGEDLLYLGRSDLNTFKVERKTRTYTDYMDDSFDVNIVGVSGVLTLGSNQITLILPSTNHLAVGQSISGDGIPAGTTIAQINNSFTITLNKNATLSGAVGLYLEDNSVLRLTDVSGVSIGDVLYQNAGRFSIITDVDSIKNTITTRIPINSWTLGAATILVGIESIIKYAPLTCGAPAAIKQVTEFLGLFQVPLFDTITISFDSDISGSEESVSLNGQVGGLLWGLYPWGNVIWGGQSRPIPLRTYVPRAKQRNTQLNVSITHREAYAYYRLSGIELYHNAGLQRVRR